MFGRQFQNPLESVIEFEHAVLDKVFLEQGKYSLKILEVRDIQGEIWIDGELFPCKEGVIVLLVSLVTIFLQQQEQIL
jgi:hypothetical protein